jgi:exodeoxyribonuclease VII large subunit
MNRRPGLPSGLNIPSSQPHDAPVFTVSQLNREVRGLLESALSGIWLEGEISNFKHHTSGHMYFSLKDEGAQVDAAMFRMSNQNLTFTPESGQSVLALVKVTVYEPRGRYQVMVQDMKPAGVGKLQLAFDQLKQKLQAEGLFDEERKRPLPQFPKRIGIVTSSGAAALRDLYSVLSRRYPAAEVLLFSAQVQGEGAGQDVANAIERANKFSQSVDEIDVLIVGRGGGSLEDLWAFNEEVSARAIASSDIPIVSAVGHEVDFTIADFVADLRAPTPSAAAELVVPDQAEVLAMVRGAAAQMVRRTLERWQDAQEKLQWLQRSHGLRRPLQRLRDAQQRMDQLNTDLTRGWLSKFDTHNRRYELLFTRLEKASPTALLKRGYTVARNADGDMIKRKDQVTVGDTLKLNLQDGTVTTEVKEIGS